MSAAEDLIQQLVRALAVEVATLMQAADSAPPALLTRAECARAMNTSVATIDRAVKLGCPHTSVGRSVRFDVAEVRAWFKKNGKRAGRKSDEAIPGRVLAAAGMKRK